TSSGRQVSTAAAHLQPITSLAVDPTGNFVLSGSEDGNVAVWSLPALLSFSRSSVSSSSAFTSSRPSHESHAPLRLFSNHRAAIVDVATAHSAGRHCFAVSLARDNTAAVWDLRTGRALRTFLLPSAPACVAIDPADRAAYIGYEDGCVQLVEFLAAADARNPLYRDATAAEGLAATAATQLPEDGKWRPPGAEFGAANCLALSYDGSLVVSGHAGGQVAKWDVGRRRYVATVLSAASPVTNLAVCRPLGFVGSEADAEAQLDPQSQSQQSPDTLSPSLLIHNVVKPRIDAASATTADTVPATYTVTAQICATRRDSFSAELSHPAFSDEALAEGLAELATWGQQQQQQQQKHAPAQGMEVDSQQDATLEPPTALTDEVARLKEQLAVEEAARYAGVEEMARLRERMLALEQLNRDLRARQQGARAQQDRAARREEDADAQARAAWLAAQKQGKKSAAGRRQQEDVSMDEGR
ncbi:Pre-rRNA-processing protein ipi3, partial [Ascosphaera acerosa]